MRLKKSPNCNRQCHYCFILYQEHLWQIPELSIITFVTAKIFPLYAIIDWDYQLTLSPITEVQDLAFCAGNFFSIFTTSICCKNIPLLVSIKDAPKLCLSAFYYHVLSTFSYLIQYIYLLKVPWQIFAKHN